MKSEISRRCSRRTAISIAGSLGLSGLAIHAGSTRVVAARVRSGSVPRPVDGNVLFRELMGHTDQRMQELDVPAVGVAVVNGQTRYTCALGVTDVSNPVLVDAQTMFRVSALSELLTGSAVAMLLDDGIVDVEATIRTYLPSFMTRDSDAAGKVTIRHILTHSAGWQRFLPVAEDNSDQALTRFVDAMGSLVQLAPPGGRYSYSVPGVILAGHLAATLTGLLFEDAARELVLSPLSMDQSSFSPQDIRTELVTHGHSRINDQIVTVDPRVSPRAAAPATGFYSNLNEMLQFAAFHAASTTPPTYLGAAMREEIHSALGRGGSAGSVIADSMGLGWMISEYGGIRISLHTGADSGHSAVIAAIPSGRFAVVVLTNADYAQDLALEIASYAVRLFTGVEAAIHNRIGRPTQELDRLVGTYHLADGPELQVSRRGDDLYLDVGPARGRALPAAALRFISPLTATYQHDGQPRYIDFVLDDDARVAWLRYFGELAVRMEA